MDSQNFQKSITQELDVIKNRVRNLIGNAHWGEEGRFKEAVLKNVIQRFLPNSISIGTGFILKENEDSNTNISHQIDLIIYDNTKPVLFREGDFIITTETNVRGIIEVKSKINITNLRQVVNSFNDLNAYPKISNNNEGRIFKGLFAFENSINNIETNENLEEILRNCNGSINHLSLGKNYFIRHWRNNRNLHPPVDIDGPFYSLYKIDNLSFSYFISNLVHITSNEELNDRYQFSFPIQGTKEVRRRKTIEL